GVVTSGTPLSTQAIDFSCSSDQLTFSRVRYDNELFSTSSIFADFNTDGRDEALFLPYEAWGRTVQLAGRQLPGCPRLRSARRALRLQRDQHDREQVNDGPAGCREWQDPRPLAVLSDQ
ncbi:MAG: hypothetical protein AAGE13_03810, partial [Pseudomonadota bacterium]